MATMEELRNYIRFLYGQYMEEKEQNRLQQAAMQESLEEMAKQLKEANATARLESDERRKMWQQFEKMTGELKEANDKVLRLTRELQTANERLGVLNSEHFGTSKSLKGTRKNKVTKAKKALNQGCKKARFFVTEVGRLYGRERLYKAKGFSAEKTKEMRNDSYTQGIIDRIKDRMEKLLAEGENQVSDLMWRALNYLHDFWDNLFAYRKDGEYAISNCAAEQAIRPQTVQRKNSLFYCSTKGAVNSAIYNTFIETCKQAGIPFREYFRRVILELKHGRTDYANLLPMTIGLKRY